MRFGLLNSQATYQRAVQTLRVSPNIQVFMDDTCVHSRNFENHLNYMEQTLSRFNRTETSVTSGEIRVWV